MDGLRLKFAAAVTEALVAVPGGGGVDGIPDRALVAYVAAADGAPCDLPWYVLAAVGAVETGHGTHGGAHLQDDGTMSVMAVSHADAFGPMQFIEPTWERYGSGNINDIDDAAPAAARLLCANGYEADPTNAIGAYNGGGNWRRYAESRRYVELVDEYAQAYAKADPKAVTVGAKGGKERTLSGCGIVWWSAGCVSVPALRRSAWAGRGRRWMTLRSVRRSSLPAWCALTV